jgi:AcrR family transcriptional regulator
MKDKSMIVTTKKTQRRRAGGRPKLTDLEQLEIRILRVAGEKFLDLGFDGTTMDGVAEAAGISKRTLYARHPHKIALFNAVLHDLIDRWLSPIAQVQSDHSELQEALVALARYLTTFALTPQSIAINRLLVSESARRPQFSRLANEAGRKAAVRSIASILREHEAKLGSIDFDLAAEQFMCLTLDNGVRLSTLNIEVEPSEIERWILSSVDLFLRGISRDTLPRRVSPV